MNNNKSTLAELLPLFWSKSKTEENIHTLLQYIQKTIQFDSAIFMTVDNVTHMVTIFIEYSNNETIRQKSSYINNLQRPYNTILDIYNGTIGKSLIVNNATDHTVTIKYLKSLGYNLKSVLSLLLLTDSEYKKRHHLILMSNQVNTFTEEHDVFLQQLREPLQQLSQEFYNNNPESPLYIIPEGPLPTNSEAQLRRCPDLAKVMRYVDIVAPTKNTVLIQGPTGVGKELVAETLHSCSAQFANQLIRVNCGAIPETLLDSEFFGFEKGSFTGATQAHKGYFERAHNGTIYLDEIGELSLNAQTRLLRVLEHNEIQRVGAERSIKINVRVIAATHRNLWSMVENGTFREDLCYRLHVFPIQIPPLCERHNDIPILADYFYKQSVQQLNLNNPPKLSQNVLAKLVNYSWPGNIRQLKHVIERSLLLSAAEHSKDLIIESLTLGNNKHHADVIKEKLDIHKKQSDYRKPPVYSKDEILKALNEAHGRIQGQGGAAAILGLHPATLRYKMQQFAIPVSRKNK